ncbi:Replicative DNA helicase [Paenibacillus plantiphilus]|uniref:Replicative DNA helicase n=1 Tax=Paenibacillus plantiphilus TaxID=2905650 RepID=A0ABM9BP77_9BACL|nr:replicative DNA helicase [Paenibacillus plantiphilus]CAH1190348.1 Replicative DNA helicase [Paenibacillus plantiphilus]
MINFNEVCDKLGLELPADIQAERSILGSTLLSKEAYVIASEQLVGGEFYEKSHARIFRAMRNLEREGNPIDIVAVTGTLQDSEELDLIGGVSYLSDLANSVPTSEHTGYYTDRVKNLFLQREAMYTAYDLLKNAAEERDIKGFVAMAETAASRLSDQSAPAQDFVSLREVLIEVWEEEEELYNTRHVNRGITGIPSCYRDLDRMTAGFQNSDLIIVAARPSVGKTALALNIAQNVAIKTGHTVAVFSLEMAAKQLTKRMVCAEGNIDASRLRTGFFEGDDWEKLSMAIGSLSEADIHIDDTPGITVNEIRAKCRRLKKERGLGLILIDYLQLIPGSGKRSNRQEEVSDISRTLKQLARELDVPIIALSQLSRGVEQRQDKRPMMSDLRESGAIEQDADIVAFLYRDDYYDKESEKKNIIEIIIAKQRNGPTGTVELAFLKNYNKFVDLDRTQRDDIPQGA